MMKLSSKCCVFFPLIIISLTFSRNTFAMEAPVAAPSTLARVDQILGGFDTRIKEPWHKPVTGFALLNRLSKAPGVEGLAYGAAIAGAGTTGLTLSTLVYAIKAGRVREFAENVGSLFASVPWGSLGWSTLFTACPVVSAVVFFNLLDSLYLSTARGKCLMFRSQFGSVMKELRALNATYRFDFASEQDAENCSRLLFVNSTWPLKDLLGQLSERVADVNRIYIELQKIEVGGIKDEGVRVACIALKDAATILSQGLLSNVNLIRRAPTFQDQEKQYAEYLKRIDENMQQEAARAAVEQAGGDLSYNATYGKPAAVVVNNAH